MMTNCAEIEFLDAVRQYFQHAPPALGRRSSVIRTPRGSRMRDKTVRGMGYFNGVLER
jgi:hypothetical protein